MLVFNKALSEWTIDPHYLTIIPFKRIWEADESKGKEVAKAMLTWIYHMYNPRSPFKEYKQATKSIDIVKSTFPKWFIEKKEKDLRELIEDAMRKNQDLKDDDKQEIPLLKIYDPVDDPYLEEAREWYLDHLEQTPLWDSYNAYSDAMYNLSAIIRSPKSSASDIKTASQELDTIPLKREKMRQQAEKDEAITLKVQGDKNIKRSERVPAGQRPSLYKKPVV